MPCAPTAVGIQTQRVLDCAASERPRRFPLAFAQMLTCFRKELRAKVAILTNRQRFDSNPAAESDRPSSFSYFIHASEVEPAVKRREIYIRIELVTLRDEIRLKRGSTR